MQNSNFAKGYLLRNKMYVYLNMLGLSMFNGVRRHVDGGHVVVVDKCSRMKRTMEFLKNLMEPTSFCNGMRHILASALEREIVVCHFHDQEIRLSP
jgi:hypothetical protein